MTTEQETVAIYIREMRRGRGFSQQSLADLAGISKRSIERIERAEGDISLPLFARVVRALDASATDALLLAARDDLTIEVAQTMAHARLGHGGAMEAEQHDSAIRQIIEGLQVLSLDQLLIVLDTVTKRLHQQRDIEVVLGSPRRFTSDGEE